MNEIVSATVFHWFLIIATASVAGTWMILDAISFAREVKAGKTDPSSRDRRFGYAIGVIIGAVGVLGCLLYQGVI